MLKAGHCPVFLCRAPGMARSAKALSDSLWW